MAYDLAAMRTHFRFLIADPSARAISNTDVRDSYLNPIYQDWFRRFERRPIAQAGISNIGAPGEKSSSVTDTLVVNGILEHVTLTGPPEQGLIRDEFNRIRWLQETEGASGQPELWGLDAKYAVGQNFPNLFLVWYPIPDQAYEFNAYVIPTLTLLAGDTTAVLLDPVSARFVTRVAAVRAAVDLGLSVSRQRAIVALLPPWVRGAFNMTWLIEDKPIAKQESLGYRSEEVRV